MNRNACFRVGTGGCEAPVRFFLAGPGPTARGTFQGSNIVRKRLAILTTVLCLALLVVGGGLFTLHRASQYVPEFYGPAIQADPADQEDASDKMLQKAAALVSDVGNEDEWKSLFTEDEINGWLAVDLVENHPDALPPSVTDPRVSIEPDRLTLACRYDRGGWKCVLSVVADVYLAEPNVVALRIRKARAGAVPLPLDEVLDRITTAARKMDFELRWQQAEGDPVALVSIRPPRDEEKRVVRIESIKLGDGEVYLAGSSESP